MRTFLFVPPFKKPTGGVAVLLDMVRHLNAAGFEAWAVHAKEGLGFYETAEVPRRALEDLDLNPEDLWLVPEGWPNALAPGLSAKARCVAYVQNWAYLFSALPEGVHWNQLPVHLLAVSDPVARFVEQTTGRKAAVLRPGIDLGRFTAPEAKPAPQSDNPIRIAFMPRKNKPIMERIRDTLAARLALRGMAGQVRWTPISGQDQDGVARLLQESHIFLATGFPEGCPLPPLEAMACGCLVVGCAGYGGWDYMRQAERDTPPACTPWWPLREVAWQGNGLWSADADVLAAALDLETAVDWIANQDPRAETTIAAARQTAAAYGLDAQRANLLELWAQAADGRLFAQGGAA